MQRTSARRRAENEAFLAALARTGNAREAARALGVHRGTYFKRRARDPAFAAQWDEALRQSQAALDPPPLAERGRGTACNAVEGAARRAERRPRPRAHADLTPVRLRDGRVQLRRVRPGTIGAAEEAAFLLALAASANVRLSAAAAGFAHSSFYARRGRSRAFAREMRLALAQGYEAVKLALMQAELPEEQHAAQWRLGDNDPPPVPTMTAAQALQLLHLHHKTVELDWDKPHRRRRRGESDETYRYRLMAMWMAEKRIEREDAAIRQALQNPPPACRGRGISRSQRRRLVEGARAARNAEPPVRGEAAHGVGERRPARRAVSSGANTDHPEQNRACRDACRRTDVTAWLGHAASSEPFLPSLDQVTGWSKAKPHKTSGAGRETAHARTAGRAASPTDESGFTPDSGPLHNPDLALFGGWRLKDGKKR